MRGLSFFFNLRNFVVCTSIIQLFISLSLLKSKKRKQNGTVEELLLVSLIPFYQVICCTIDRMPVIQEIKLNKYIKQNAQITKHVKSDNRMQFIGTLQESDNI